MEPVDQRALEVVRSQRGCATRAQLREDASISHATLARRLASGRWSQPLPGVIDLGTHEASWRLQLQQLLLATGPASWVSHVCAAHLHGFLDVRAPARADILVRRGASTRVGDLALHTTRALADDEMTIVDGLRCTVKARTLLDLAPGTTAVVLERYLADLSRRDRRALRQVGELLDRYRYAAGRRRLALAVARLPGDAGLLGSPLEVLGVPELLRLGAPPPVLQYRVRDAGGAVIKRVDAAWPSASTVVEFDGAAYHETAGARTHDEQVRARMRALGWTVEVLRRADLDGSRLAEIAARLRRTSPADHRSRSDVASASHGRGSTSGLQS